MAKTLSRLKTPWKFFIDVEQWIKNDPLVFDKDESDGYFRNASMGLLCLLQATDMPGDDLDFIIALRNVLYHNKSSRGLTASVSSGIGKSSFTESGMRELLEKMRVEKKLQLSSSDDKTGLNLMPMMLYEAEDESSINENISYVLQAVEKGDQYIGLTRVSTIQQVVAQCLEYSTQYRAAISAAKNDDEKITAIVSYIQNMHQYHPFADGNGRTFVFFILNKLLMDNDLSPSIVNNPGNFTGWSVKELTEEVKKGQERFEALCDADEKEEMECTRLLKAIRESIQLTSTDEREIFLKKDELDQYANQFHKAVLENHVQKQLEVLNQVPTFQRIYFSKNQLLRQDYPADKKEHLESILKNLRMLQYYGLDQDKNLLRFAVENSQIFSSVEPLLEILFHSSYEHEDAWSDLIVDMTLNGREDNQDKLRKAIETANKIKCKSWFDHRLYVDMLKKNNYVSFDMVPLFINSKYLETRSEIVKKYIYSDPTIVNDVMAIMFQENKDGKFPHRKDAVIDEWCQFIVKNPTASKSLKLAYISYGGILHENPDIKTICLSQPLWSYGLASAYASLALLAYQKEGWCICIKHPEHAAELVDAMSTLEKIGVLKFTSDNEYISTCVKYPKYASELANAFERLGELRENADIKQALSTKPEHAERLSRSFIVLNKRGQLNLSTIQKCLEFPVESNRELAGKASVNVFFKPIDPSAKASDSIRSVSLNSKGKCN